MRNGNRVKALVILVAILALAFPVLSATAGSLYQATATPEPEATAEETPEAEESPTAEVTVETTATETVEATETAVATETIETTETVEVTETVTATGTVEATETVTATGTVEATETVTATGTVEVTETVTATGTVEATPTITGTETVTATPTGTVAATPSGIATATPTARPTEEAMRPESVIAGMVFTPTGEITATASLANSDGDMVGTVLLRTVEVGPDALPAVLVEVEVEDFTAAEPGSHGLHIHETGECEAPDFQSAGGHFNPTDRGHGFLHPEGPHAGDLPMIRIEEDGSATYGWVTGLISLTEGDTNILDEDGSALIVHSGLDDYFTDPSGNSGERIACGVITQADEAQTAGAQTPTGTPDAEGTPTPEDTPEADGTPTPQAEVTPGEAQAVDVAAVVVAGVSGAEGINVLDSTFTEYTVVNQEGDTLGQIDGAVVDAETGDLLYAIIEYGGFLDIGEQTIAIPLNALQWLGEEQLLLPAGEEQLETFPEISSDWPIEAGVDWDAEVRSFWQGVGIEESLGAEAPSAVVRTDDLVDAEVAGVGDTGGTISDLVLDLAQNRVQYALLDLGTESLLAIPWQAIEIQDGALALDTQLDVDLLQEAPGINRNTPGLLTEPDWDEDLRNFWEEAGYQFERAVEEVE